MKNIKIFTVFFLLISNNLIAQEKIISGTSNCFQLVTGTIKNKVTNKIITDATVELYSQNRLVQTLQTNNKGVTRFKVACDASYQLVAFKDDLSKTKKNFITSDAGNINVEFVLLIEDPEKCTITLEGIVKNDEDEFMNESVVIVYDKGKEINRTTVKRGVTYQFILECNKPYKIIAQSVNHIEYSYVQNTGTKNNKKIEKNFTLQKLACIKNLYGALTDSKTNKILVGANIQLLLDGKFIQNTRTNSDGKFFFKIKCSANYTISASKTGYQKSIFIVPEIEYDKEADFFFMQINPKVVEPIIEKEIIEKEITEVEGIKAKKNNKEVKPTNEKESIIKNQPTINLLEVGKIKFAINQSKITRNIAIKLDKIVDLMLAKPEIKIFIKSHTDSRGPDTYNINITEARAQSIVNYIVSNNIDSSRVAGKGYGETELTNECSNGKRCSEAEHQKNRRNEFIVTNE